MKLAPLLQAAPLALTLLAFLFRAAPCLSPLPPRRVPLSGPLAARRIDAPLMIVKETVASSMLKARCAGRSEPSCRDLLRVCWALAR